MAILLRHSFRRRPTIERMNMAEVWKIVSAFCKKYIEPSGYNNKHLNLTWLLKFRREIPASTKFVIGVKLNSVEFQESGLTNDDAIKVAKIVEAEGFDFIELTGGNYEKWQVCCNN
jgi:hypothetical protein